MRTFLSASLAYLSPFVTSPAWETVALRQQLAVVGRNNSIHELMLPLPSDTRDAGRRESVLRSLALPGLVDPLLLGSRNLRHWIWEAWSEGSMRAAAVVVAGPHAKGPPQVRCVKRDKKV